MDELKQNCESRIYSILIGFKDIHNQIKQFEESTVSPDDIEKYYTYTSPEAFYIKIAERIDDLSKTTNNVDQLPLLAKKTRTVLIPLVKYTKALKLVEILDELCFKLENPNTYNAITNTINDLDNSCGLYCAHFLSRLDRIFDSHSNFIHDKLRELQPFIKTFFHERRSAASIERFITKIDSKENDWQNDIEKIKNISRISQIGLSINH